MLSNPQDPLQILLIVFIISFIGPAYTTDSNFRQMENFEHNLGIK